MTNLDGCIYIIYGVRQSQRCVIASCFKINCQIDYQRFQFAQVHYQLFKTKRN
jgi:hypothetical protein